MAAVQSPAAVEAFYCFNSEFGPHESNEHEKVLYHYPETVPFELQMRAIGLCEAVINITRTFGSDRLCEAMHTQKRKQSFFEAEPDFWMVLTVKNPSETKRSKENKTMTRWREGALNDMALRGVVEQAYSMFRMFHGTMAALAQREGVQALRDTLKTFLAQYLLTLDIERLNLVKSLEGIQFLPVDKNVYLRIVSCVNLINNTFPQVRECVFLFKDHLVWSGLEQEDIRVLFRFLRLHMGLKDSQVPATKCFLDLNKDPASGFVVGPKTLPSSEPVALPDIYIGAGEDRLKLAIFQQHNITLVLLLEAEEQSHEPEFFAQLQRVFAPQVEWLAPAIQDNYVSRKAVSEEPYRYMYFNHMNLAIKSTITKATAITPAVMKVLLQMREDFANVTERVHEQIIGTSSNTWVVGKRSEDRDLYLIIEDKKASLIEVYEEQQKLNSTLFGNIFLD
mmetsp:Transcript_7492/g.31726  ORF Transcript_7492/g.31726 Transcript_7492/m.31726 type:complete len:450 (+) Transcript_7492:94-1443(+)